MSDHDYPEQESSERRLRKRVAEALRNAQIEEQKKNIVRQVLDDGAYGRLMNIRASNREMYSKLVDMIISLVQSQRLKGKLTEEQFVSILSKVNERPETKIDYRRK